MTLTPETKKLLIRFVAGGIAAVLIKQAEKTINKRADEYYSDEPSETPED